MPLEVRELTQPDWPLWDKLIAVSPQRSLFVQRWWMDIVTDGAVRLLGCFQGHNLVAGLPIWPCRSFGVSYLRQPLLTPYWGPVLQPLPGKYSTQLSTESSILRAFADALAPWTALTLAYHPSLTNWLAFYWCGFSQTIRYSYRITDWEDMAEQSGHFPPMLQSALRRSHEQGCCISTALAPDQLLQLSSGVSAQYSTREMKEIACIWPALARAALDRQCLHTSACLDATGEILSTSAVVWDEHCAYRVLSTGVRDHRYPDGLIRHLVHEVEAVRELAPAYDFTGAMFRPLGEIFRCFGGRLTPSYLLDRHTCWHFRLLKSAGTPSPRITARQFRAFQAEDIHQAIQLETVNSPVP